MGRMKGTAALAAAATALVARTGSGYARTRPPKRHMRLPGAERGPNAIWESTRAITIAAPPAEAWPWIVQMGYPAFRGGWYTPHWLDRIQWKIPERSADRIRPELQSLKVGDHVPDSRDWSVYFTVVTVEPAHALVLHSTRHILRPIRSVEFSWAFVLEAASEDTTRLIIRARAWCAPHYAWILLSPLIRIGDLLNTSAILRGIKQRVETCRYSITDGRAYETDAADGSG